MDGRLASLAVILGVLGSPACFGEKIEVQLGDPSITAGIPGEGPLTNSQIEAWLSQEDVHKEIQPSLPLGLSAAAANIHVPADNPMTKAKIELGRQL